MHGSRLRSAISCARRCFLTVIGKYAPPLTVASLAAMTQSRPATRPIPAIEPRARRGAVVEVVRGERGELEQRRARVEQPRDALARQQLAARDVALGGARSRRPRGRARAAPRRSATSARCAASFAANAAESGRALRAEHDAHLRPFQSIGPAIERVRAELAAEQLAHRVRREEQRAQVDPGLDPHLVQHPDEVLGGDVAGRARRHRAAAELAEARLERRAAGLQRGEHVGQPLAARVVEVRGELRPRRRAPPRPPRRTPRPAAGSPSRSCRRRRPPARPRRRAARAIASTRARGTTPS